jgi:hypothetical protein
VGLSVRHPIDFALYSILLSFYINLFVHHRKPIDMRSTVPAAPSSTAGVRRIARWMRGLALLGAIVLVGLAASLWTSPAWLAAAAREAGLGDVQITVTPDVQWMAALVGMLPIAASLFALLQVWRLFGDYAEGAIFTAGATSRLRRLAWGVLGLAVAQVLARTGAALVLTLHNPPGQRLLVLSLSSHDYVLLMFSVLLLAIAWVMVEATRLARENAEFV